MNLLGHDRENYHLKIEMFIVMEKRDFIWNTCRCLTDLTIRATVTLLQSLVYSNFG